MDYTTWTPQQVDEALADLWEQIYTAEDELAKVTKWDTDLAAAIAKGNFHPYELERREARRASYATRITTLQDTITDLTSQAYEYEAEHGRRRWTRFFLVQDGHIHSHTECRTCHNGKRRTRFGWLPTLSGKDEAAAIAHFEADGKGRSQVLCTVCYPDFPVAWTTKQAKPGMCTGTYATGYDLRRYSPRGDCGTCGQRVSVTSTGKARAHKAPTAA